ncbi:MAG: diacylglycerol kinase family protein [Atopobiaceae bacterium]|nr:diacylglycerol kinase [Atopobiaceae bacterium]
MRCLIVHNLKSGFGSNAIFEFERALLNEGDECVLRILKEGQRADDVLADAESFDLAVLSGGDGTTSSLLYGLRYRDVLTCVFPSGTANLFCLNLGIAAEPSALARACRVGRCVSTDLGELTFTDIHGSRHKRGFSIMMGTGFDAQIMRDAVAGKQTLGAVAYFTAVFSNVHPPVRHFVIDMDGTTIERDGISCLVANTTQIQAGIEIVPDSRMDDGLLEVIILEQADAVGLLRPLIASIVDHKGDRLGRPEIETFRGQHIRITPSLPVPLEYDGETYEEPVASYEAVVLPAANRIVVDGLSSYHDPSDSASEENPRFGSGELASFPEP